ncbi:MAG TPA: SsrA-binding protein SmpB [Thermoanaerobaculia bacterium]|nr:SsrA-binding protein SmpB [Thermoanaerobaculia bacterium]
MSKRDGDPILASNRRALHEYHILEKLEAGIALRGTEVKSVRAGRVQLQEAFVEFRNGEAYLVGAHVSAYSHGNRENHEPERARKLLMHRREIDRFFGRSRGKGHTVVPLKMYLSGGRVKVEIALAVGKQQHDKRQAAREREMDREVAEAMSRARKGR